MIGGLGRHLWNTFGVYKAKHPLIAGMWFVGGRLFKAREATEEERFLMGLDLKGKVVDVGANVGIMTLFFARSVGPEGSVVGFEPHPDSFQRLSRNVRVNRLRNVRIVNKGVGEQRATLKLYQPSRHLSGATLNGERAARLDEGDLIIFTVEIDTLDNMIGALALPPPDFVKIDVEGYEEQVLKGAAQTIHRYRPAFFIEIHRLADGLPTTSRVIETLSASRYSFYHVETGEYVDAHAGQKIHGGHIYAVADTSN